MTSLEGALVYVTPYDAAADNVVNSNASSPQMSSFNKLTKIVFIQKRNNRIKAKKGKITYSYSYLHPKLNLWMGKNVSLLAECVTRACERPRLVRGGALLIEVQHSLVTLVGREVGSRGFSLKES